MATETLATMSGEEMIALSKKHTLFEWSAQSKVDPIPVARATGSGSTSPCADHSKSVCFFDSAIISSPVIAPGAVSVFMGYPLVRSVRL